MSGKSLIEERVRASSDGSPYEDHHDDSGFSDLTSGTNHSFTGDAGKNKSFGGYLPTNMGVIGDTLEYYYGNVSLNGQYWINNWYAYRYLGEYHSTWNTSFGLGDDTGLEPYGEASSGGKFFVNDRDNLTLPDGTRSYGITLMSNHTKQGQVYTYQYNGAANHMIASTRGNQTYKVSFYAKIPRPGYIGSNSGTSSPIVPGYGASPQYAPAGDGVTFGGTNTRTEFGNTYAGNTLEAVCGGELDVWLFPCSSGYSAFNTGYPNYSGAGGNGASNQYKRVYNGEHVDITFQEGVYIRLNGFESYITPYGNQQTAGTDLTRYWQYFEYTITVKDDNSAQSGGYTPRFISARFDQNKKGETFNNPYDSHDHYRFYPGVTIANFCITPVNISMIKTDAAFDSQVTSGTVTLGGGTQSSYADGQTDNGGLTYQA